MINYVVGDATEPQGDGPKIIAHICNDAGAWGAGFVLALSRKWPEPEEHYRSLAKDGRGYPLGSIQTVKVDYEKFTVVCNMIAQHGIISQYATSHRAVNYGALAVCLNQLAQFRSSYEQSIHMPRIGAGLGGGDWDIVEELIEFILVKKGINVTVYDLP
jgi:O-acetyl-ADP-ribose deacetylase (regulator of RNase III)